MFNPIICMLHNEKENKWHPIVFEEKPLPGGNGPMRHKSKMHHTGGFDNREDAVISVPELEERVKEQAIGEVRINLEKDFPWDGEGIPAMVIFFNEAGEPVLG